LSGSATKQKQWGAAAVIDAWSSAISNRSTQAIALVVVLFLDFVPKGESLDQSHRSLFGLQSIVPWHSCKIENDDENENESDWQIERVEALPGREGGLRRLYFRIDSVV
jgi:hypothetical protein